MDSAKWKDSSQFKNLTHIRDLVKLGVYFNDQKFTVASNETQRNFAPKHFLSNKDKYRHILENPSRPAL